MTRTILRVTALALATAAAPAALAAEGTDQGFYAGLIVGNNSVDVSGADVDDGTSIGLLLGYRLAANVGIELATGNSEHDFPAVPACTMEIDTIGVYGAFRSAGSAYFKGKLGFLSEDVSADCVGMTASDSGMSYGLGGGIRVGGNGAVELEYTQIEADVSRLSLTALYNF